MRFIRISTLTLLLFAAYAAKCQLATGVNYNATTPAAPSGTRNVTWQNDGGRPTVNASAFVTYPTLQVVCPASGDLSSPVNTTLGSLSSSQGGIADARACVNATTWSTAITISVPNTVILLPCASLSQSQPITVAAQTRNVTMHGCSYMGGSASSGTVGGTVLNFTGSTAAFIVGDSGYVYDTPGFTLTDLAVITASAGSGAHAINLYRAQEVHMENLYLIGNTLTGQTAIVLDGTGNYTGGYFANLKIDSFGTAALLTGHLSGSVVDDYANASTFVKIHVDCPTSGGSPVAGTYGFNVAGGDGNTWVGGDVEGCSKVMYLGAHANGNTVVGQRSENSTSQYYADTGSTYNYVATGGTFFTGDLFDAGSRNSFWDAFHRTANGINGDWYASQVDATLTNHQRLGIGLGNERGLLNEVQTDYGYRWIYGLTDATAGEQFYIVQDVLSNLNRLSIGQANSGGSSANNQTALNSAGSAAVILNGSNNSGTGGVVIGSGGSSATQVANFDSSGNLSTLGNHLFYNGATLAYELEGDSGTSFTIQNNNATTPGRVFKSNVNGSTDVDSEGTSPFTVNNTSTGGTGGMSVYKGGASSSVLLFQVNPNGSGTPFMQFPGLAPGSGNSCLYADSSGFFHGTGSSCGSGGGGGGTVTSVAVTAPSDFTLSGCTITTSGTCAISWNSTASGSAPTWNQSTTGTASNITSSSNSTLTTLSALSLPIGQVTGTINATQVNGAAVPASKTIVGTNGSGQFVDASSTTLANNTTGNAATATTLAATPSLCTGGQVPVGILANGNATGCLTPGGGTTTNALTFSTSTTTASGSFNGATAVTVDYADVGAAGLAASNTFTGTNSFGATTNLGTASTTTGGLYFFNAGAAGSVELVATGQAANDTLTIPALLGADTVATLTTVQTFNGNKTFSGNTTFSDAGVQAVFVSSSAGAITESAAGGTHGLIQSNTTAATSSTCTVSSGANSAWSMNGFDWVSSASTASSWTFTPTCTAGNPTAANTLTLKNSVASSSVPAYVVINGITHTGYGTTSTITGTALTASCDSGTVTISGAIIGHPVTVSSTTGADVGAAFDLRASVTSTNTVTVYICGTGTPASLAYNVAVF